MQTINGCCFHSRKFPKCGLMDHTWVAHRWIQDCGLPQYSKVFEEHLVDGRLLNALSKKDLEKHLGIQRKFHHVSILHAIQLLRNINFDKEVILLFLKIKKCYCSSNYMKLEWYAHGCQKTYFSYFPDFLSIIKEMHWSTHIHMSYAFCWIEIQFYVGIQPQFVITHIKKLEIMIFNGKDDKIVDCRC